MQTECIWKRVQVAAPRLVGREPDARRNERMSTRDGMLHPELLAPTRAIRSTATAAGSITPRAPRSRCARGPSHSRAALGRTSASGSNLVVAACFGERPFTEATALALRGGNWSSWPFPGIAHRRPEVFGG